MATKGEVMVNNKRCNLAYRCLVIANTKQLLNKTIVSNAIFIHEFFDFFFKFCLKPKTTINYNFEIKINLLVGIIESIELIGTFFFIMSLSFMY